MFSPFPLYGFLPFPVLLSRSFSRSPWRGLRRRRPTASLGTNALVSNTSGFSTPPSDSMHLF